MKAQLEPFFRPSSIAIIGASEKPASLGFAVMNNMIVAGYAGRLVPVNPKYREVLGLTCYRSVLDVPEPVDLGVIQIPAKLVPGIVEDCGKAGIKALLILSAGFKEAGDKGHALLEDVLATAKKYDIRILGPNCLGIMNPAIGMNATFASRGALPGRIAFISQSGALCASILDWATEQGVGFSYFVSIGSMTDVGFHDLIEYMSTDPQTSSILIYMESLTDARKFMSAARAYARTKPILILKSGSSEEGAKAALSHTGSLAGNDLVFDAAFKRAGMLRVEKMADLFYCAQALAMQPRPTGPRLAIVTNAGGPAVLTTDYLIRKGGKIAALGPQTMDSLNQLLSDNWSHNNPVDILGDGTAEQFGRSLRLCLDDPAVDAVLVIFVPQAITPPDTVAWAVVQESRNTDKPVFASWMGETDVTNALEILEKGSVPAYRFPESAVDVFLLMNDYAKNLEILYETPEEVPEAFTPDRMKVRQVIDQALASGQTQLGREAITEILDAYEIPVTRVIHAPTSEAAVNAAEQLGYPVAVKIDSPDISHKTDVGGVVLNIHHPDLVMNTFDRIMERASKARPEARLLGVTVEAMANKRYELMIGAKQDPVFGPVLVFGMGGVAVEVFKDLQMALPPLNMSLAKHLVQGTKIFKLLDGYRSMPGVDLDAIYFLLIRFAYLVMDFPEIREMDLNPFAVDEHGGVVLDARMMIESVGAATRPYEHLVISPYPSQYCKVFQLKDGGEVKLRPIKPEDEPLEAKLFDYLSKETIYFRFFGYIPQGDPEFLSRFTQIDYDREMAIVAETPVKGQRTIIGVVRIVGDNWNDGAEFAIVVADAWQHQGLGSAMADYIIQIARERGFKRLYASFLKSNTAMDRLFRAKGFHVRSDDAQTNYGELMLETPVENG
ncbi:MAG: bifunctional acetate--CoA ligase family protein/GNAT family N-acetyltransferase [Saprospiraceae bacterium]|nr:bifunctional acetate--CoA ligase family protein/GNAT family N-acetyltransferase [Saprospiraceae bacterium]